MHCSGAGRIGAALNVVAMVEEVRENVEESILTYDGIPAVVLMTGRRRLGR